MVDEEYMWIRLGVFVPMLVFLSCARKTQPPADLPEIAPSSLTRAAGNDHIQKRRPLPAKPKE